MRKTNALYLKRQRLIAETYRETHIHRYTETHRHTERHTQRHTDKHRETHTKTHTHTHTQTYTQRDACKELLQRFTLPFATHMNLVVAETSKNSSYSIHSNQTIYV